MSVIGKPKTTVAYKGGFLPFGIKIQMWASSSVMGHGVCMVSGLRLPLFVEWSGMASSLTVTSWFKFTALAQATASIFMSTIVPVSERIARI